MGGESKIKVKVQLFAEFSRLTGTDRLEMEMPAAATVGDVVEAVRGKYPVLRNYGRSTLVAKGLEFADAAEEVREGDEISLMPPLAGG